MITNKEKSNSNAFIEFKIPIKTLYSNIIKCKTITDWDKQKINQLQRHCINIKTKDVNRKWVQFVNGVKRILSFLTSEKMRMERGGKKRKAALRIKKTLK